jgi:hypothetical protein
MNTAGNRKQDVGSSSAPMVVRCGAVNCRNVADAGRYCLRCWTEISALRQMAVARDERREKRAQKQAQRRYGAAISFEMLCVKVRRRLWIPLLAFVLGGLLYFFATELGDAFCTWMDGFQ